MKTEEQRKREEQRKKEEEFLTRIGIDVSPALAVAIRSMLRVGLTLDQVKNRIKNVMDMIDEERESA